MTRKFDFGHLASPAERWAMLGGGAEGGLE
jgi:hypothetical protein